ncbi:Xaa-Pro dipeptidase [Gordonia hirsuta DSM 44140 = NBRC 16056]|uniref:Xaa-Pro dipeptidase n=1 Tax=Gordonia hirsuta DSM 44140 = NBRC 16056 TaxID=1121927 RepID=L7L5A1_9ACTN|nr:Xaa-Pro peptidase family protein [Gordonia hirsuta]GAC56109.1 Xaa-Pro dipeptidase [Gordonia hirsuta DSM 44140 = NBRC 16056]
MAHGDSAPDGDTRFDTQVYAQRLARAAQLTGAAGLDAIVVGTGPDLRYLTGMTADTFERLTALVIPAVGAPRLVTPRLELAAVRDSAIPDLDVTVRDWVDGADPYALALAGLEENSVLAVSDSLPALHLVPLADRLQAPLRLATPVLRELRMIKDDAELAALRTAGAAIDRVHARMGQWLRPGRTEAAVAADIAAAIVAEGHTEAAFVIVGSGPNGADPHHEHSERVIGADDIVVIDIGGPLPIGYNSDCTRTYCFAEPPAEVAQAYAALERAQAASVAAVRPGATAESIDAAGRTLLQEAGLGEHFIHRTGHGIGLSVHEEPYIVAGNTDVLRPGMVFSVEPGVYLPGRWGARIEDIVIVTDDGAEPVNTRPHGLTRLEDDSR